MGESRDLDQVHLDLYSAVTDNAGAKVEELFAEDDRIDVNWVHPDKGWSFLHQAAASAAVEAINLLLAQGADIELRDRNNKTALHLAIEGDSSHPLLVPLLVEHVFKVNAQQAKQIKDLQAKCDEYEKDRQRAKQSLPFPNRESIGAPTAATSSRNKEKAEDRVPGTSSASSTPASQRRTQGASGASGNDSTTGSPATPRSRRTKGDSQVRTPRLEQGSILSRKRRQQYDLLVAAADREFKNVTSSVMRQFRLLDDPPKPVYRLYDALCVIAGQSGSASSSWPEVQKALATSSFREKLSKARPENCDIAEMRQLKKICHRLDHNLNGFKLPAAPYVLSKWVNAFEQATNFCMLHPLNEKHLPAK